MKSRYLKSNPLNLNFAEVGNNVDVDNGIIKNVILAKAGEAKGHGVHLDTDFINDAFIYAFKNFNNIGLKCRFGHPNMSNDALGSEVGRFKNFSQREDELIADLHLFESANLSPTHKGAKDWLLSMANESPESIMCSIVFKPSDQYQLNDNKKVYDTDKWIEEKEIYIGLDQLTHCDIVDEGAVTEKLFSSELNIDKFAVIATNFLDSNPQIFEFIKEQPDKIPGFIDLYNSYNEKKSKNMDDKLTLSERINKALTILKGGQIEEPLKEETVKELEETKTENQLLNEKIDSLFSKLEKTEAYFNSIIGEKDQQIEQLSISLEAVTKHLEFIAKNTTSKGYKEVTEDFNSDTVNKLHSYPSADEILRKKLQNKN